MKKRVMVTGAFGYSGSYIAEELLRKGHEVHTITTKKSDDKRIIRHDLIFKEDHLINSLSGMDVLINNYWVRFNHKNFTHEKAVKNAKILFSAAKKAGVKKIVHISITNPSADSDLSYFRGKAEMEQALIATGIPYTILRPTVLFGKEDILVNNISWIIRNFPFYPLFGDGQYKLEPVFVEDLAELSITKAFEEKSEIIDAIGPEVYTFKELVQEIMSALEIRKPIISISKPLAMASAKVMGFFLNDVIITEDEIKGLMANLLYTGSKPACETKFSNWIRENKKSLGKKYANELSRR